MSQNRQLLILKLLWDKTDEEHTLSTYDIMNILKERGLLTSRKTVAEDILQIQKLGFDIICTRSKQNEYFFGERYLQLPELKLLMDAVQSAKFISQNKTMELIDKITSLAGPYQANQLKRNLYVAGKAKTVNESIYYTVDLINTAIQNQKPISFQYIEYTADKKKILKHDGQVYIFSPYDLVWSNDCYYVFGWDEKHEKVIKFRVDRIFKPKISLKNYHHKPSYYNISEYCKRVNLMYDGKTCSVKLLCNNCMMKTIVDRFGEDVVTERYDSKNFIASVDVSVSSTFYSWIFNYNGQIKILEPDDIIKEYKEKLNAALKT